MIRIHVVRCKQIELNNLFVVGEHTMWLLLSAQLVTSVPTHRLPGRLPFGRGAAGKQEIELNERQPEPEEETVDDLTPRGQILWIRGLTRLQHQVRMRMRLAASVIQVCVY